MRADDPIVGTWGDGSGGEVTVKADGARWLGRVSASFPGSAGACIKVGALVWQIDRRSGSTYEGGVATYMNDPGCTYVLGPGTWTLGSDGSTLRQCVSVLQGVPPICTDLRRVSYQLAAIAIKVEGIRGTVAGEVAKGYGYTSGRGSIGFVDGTKVKEGSVLTLTFRTGPAKAATLRLAITAATQLDVEKKVGRFATRVTGSTLTRCRTGEEGLLILSRGTVFVAACGRVLTYRMGLPGQQPGARVDVIWLEALS